MQTPALIILAYLVAGAIAFLGYRAKALASDGAAAACIVGGTIFGLGGVGWAALLVIFFATSTFLTFFRANYPRKQRATEAFEKIGKRDAAQVFANGGVAALLALASSFLDVLALPILFSMFAGAMAAATADTWATELGVLSASRPRMITSGWPVRPGTSGAVTLLGGVASVTGALFIALMAAYLSLPQIFSTQTFVGYANPVGVGISAFVGGLVGSLADSVMGATIQAYYYCPQCEQPTESRLHKCGTQTRLVRGWAFINNDFVNLLATAIGALVAGLIWATI